MDSLTQNKIDAEVFNRLLKHLDMHKEVQNIDLMILADFCRNCLAKWYAEAAQNEGIDLDYEQAREHIYKMPYSEWKEKHQLPATEAQLTALQQRNS
ncbi:DUF1244 domain-containing protein [Alteromonas ponticola]|uniref:DUF1244 domain-containing protein n=1 Tax=Alteromonas ponticola TaxID=2720613 RepID=A0ABX1QWE3_9ALTE|nr:DUF1244 domain-containing protein [Alteromonas ponticola]NMH58562.1 DUF1244 domain-containing protein [Alteromonas ponticola]